MRISALQTVMCSFALASGVFGQTTVARTNPVGFVTVTVPAQSDAVISIPMRRPAVFQGTISSIAGNQVTLSSTPVLPAGTVFALMLASGTKEGMIGKITAQSAAVVTVSLDAGDNFTG